MSQAQKTKLLVEEFSGEEHAFRTAVLEGLEEFGSVTSWTEEGMKEGYSNFFTARAEEAEELVKRTGELGLSLGELRGSLGRWGRSADEKGVDKMGSNVEWLGIVIGQADEGFKDILSQAKKGKKEIQGLGKGWMGEELLKREVVEIEKYRDLEGQAGVVLDAISKEYMEENMEGVIAKLEKAMASGEVAWW